MKCVGHLNAVSSGYGLALAASAERKTANKCDNFRSDMCSGREYLMITTTNVLL